MRFDKTIVKCKIIWIRMYDFPVGGAPQNRTLSICKGLLADGHEIEVHVFGPGKQDAPENKHATQLYNGVKICNHSYSFVPCKSRLKQTIGLAIGFPRVILAVLRSNCKESTSYIILGNNANLYSMTFFFLTRFIRARLVRELNEFPPYEISALHRNPFIVRWKKHTNFKWFDDFIVMTNPLIKYYKPLSRKSSRFFLLPMTVDLDRFKDLPHDLEHAQVVTYCGDLSQQKDGVFTLIESVAIVKAKYPSIKLHLIGENRDPSHMKHLRQLVSSMHLESNVRFFGFISPDQIPQLLSESSILALCRPSSRQADGGFPTKLGEYLASSVPVVVTNVGEIGLYLQNNVSAFIAVPDSAQSFADSMLCALENYEHARVVGLCGRKVALNTFSHLVQGARLSEFFCVQGVN